MRFAGTLKSSPLLILVSCTQTSQHLAPPILSINLLKFDVRTDRPRVPTVSLGPGSVLLTCRIAESRLDDCKAIQATSPPLGDAAIEIIRHWNISNGADQKLDEHEVQLELKFENDACVDVVGAIDPFLHCIPY